MIAGQPSERFPFPSVVMKRNATVNPTSEHAIYLRLFITNGGGW